MTEIWYTHLYGIVKVRTRTPATPKGVGPLIVEQTDEKEDSLGNTSIFANSRYSPCIEGSQSYIL